MRLFEISAILAGFSILSLIFGIDFMKGQSSVLGRMIYQYENVFALAQQLSPTLLKYMPAERVSACDERLIWAGRPLGLTAESFTGVKFLFGVLGGMVGVLFSLIGLPMVFAAALAALLFFFPELLLADRIKRRQWEITYNLPDMVSMIAKATGRGVEFGRAFEAAADMMPGVIGEEMSETWRQMATGRSRREAFKGFAARTGVPTVRRFSDAVISGDERGNDQLTIQLEAMAADAQSALVKAAEEKAHQKPSLMLLPIFLFILLPTLIMLMYPQFMLLGELM